MSDLDKLFFDPKINQEQIEVESVLNELSIIMSDLANESKEFARDFSCDDIADMLDNYVSSKFVEGLLMQTMVVFSDVLRDAQHSMHHSVPEQLDLLLKTNIHPTVALIMAEIKKEKQMYDWIKTTSII